MIEIRIIEKADTPDAWLGQFKAYAAISDGSQDSLLQAILTKAVLSVQQKADRSLIPCTIELYEDEVENCRVRLYQTVENVVSVRDGMGRNEYWEQVGKTVKVFSNTAVVTYHTEPRLADIDALLPVVYQYATALYDGEDNKTLASILSQC